MSRKQRDGHAVKEEIAMRRLVPAVMAMTLMTSVALAGTKNIDGVEVRDWDAIDGNDDRYVSPVDMEGFLREIRAMRERTRTE